MLVKIRKFLFGGEKSLDFKFENLMVILSGRGVISPEEWNAFQAVHILRKFSKKPEEVLLEKIAGIYRDIIPVEEGRKVITKLLYQPGYFEEAKRKYYDHILPFIEKASWIYFLKPGLYRGKNAN